MNAAHRALRDGTRAEHEALDGLFARFDLSDRRSYARFLSAHAEALAPVEAILDASAVERVAPDWPARGRMAALRDDLAAVGGSVPAPSAGERIDDVATLAGMLYVIEGSRLGGRLLARQVAADLPTDYLDADQGKGSWRNLLDMLEAILSDPAMTDRAIVSACQTFARFAAAGRKWLEVD